MKVPHPIPYQGSKRWLAGTLCQCVPRDAATLFEPFAGSAAFTLAAAACGSGRRYVLGDVHPPIAELWRAIINSPEALADEYEDLWRAQSGRERVFYDEIRAKFNRTNDPASFLFLLARCVKAAIRYNAKGEFNNSPDNRRRGAAPDTMRGHVLGAARLLRGKSKICCADFRETISKASPRDLIYMDPPYQGVCKDRDARYVRGLRYDEFCDALRALLAHDLSFLISYDGRTGDRRYGRKLPDDLELTHVEVLAGRSTQETLLGRDTLTYESLYFSPALMKRLGRLPSRLTRAPRPEIQFRLFEGVG